MTRRERLERKLEKREEWADGRDAKAEALHNRNAPYTGDYAFNTQPGHIPERARVIARTDKAFEHSAMAEHHREKAAGLERQLDRTIFSDDEDAIEQLEVKAAKKDAEAERDNAINKAWRKHKGDEPALFAAWQALGVGEALCTELVKSARQYSWSERKGPCDSSYARAEARRCRERIKVIRAHQQRQQDAEANGGASIRKGGDWCSITFAEKPERETLTELKAAGFRWGGGSWSGPIANIPASVAEMLGGAA